MLLFILAGVKCPPQKEKGTTIACAIGTDEMYYCGDGRAVSIYEEVISGDGVKHVDQDGIVLTICGTSEIFVPMLQCALNSLN